VREKPRVKFKQQTSVKGRASAKKMKSDSPLVPQGSILEQKQSGRSRVKLAVFCVLGIHVVGLLGLLLAGCKREPAQPPVDTTFPTFTDTNLPADPYPEMTPDTNIVAVPEVPYVAPPPEVAPPPVVNEHVIVKGDTFSGLATRYKVTVSAIQAANPNVNPARLQIGQKIIIPAPTTPAPGTEVAVPVSPGTGEVVYTVKSGDTLTAIASKHNTTVRAIQTANNLTTTRIKVGDKLKIPAATGTTAPQ